MEKSIKQIHSFFTMTQVFACVCENMEMNSTSRINFDPHPRQCMGCPGHRGSYWKSCCLSGACWLQRERLADTRTEQHLVCVHHLSEPSKFWSSASSWEVSAGTQVSGISVARISFLAIGTSFVNIFEYTINHKILWLFESLASWNFQGTSYKWSTYNTFI